MHLKIAIVWQLEVQHLKQRKFVMPRRWPTRRRKRDSASKPGRFRQSIQKNCRGPRRRVGRYKKQRLSAAGDSKRSGWRKWQERSRWAGQWRLQVEEHRRRYVELRKSRLKLPYNPICLHITCWTFPKRVKARLLASVVCLCRNREELLPNKKVCCYLRNLRRISTRKRVLHVLIWMEGADFSTTRAVNNCFSRVVWIRSVFQRDSMDEGREWLKVLTFSV